MTDPMALAVDVLSAVLLLGGALSCLLGALGLVRLPDLPARLQATTKPQTLGLLLILLGTAVTLRFENASTLVLVVLFQVLTAPVIAQMIGRSAYRTGAVHQANLVVDELSPRITADGSGPGPIPGPDGFNGRAGDGRAGDGRAGDGQAGKDGG